MNIATFFLLSTLVLRSGHHIDIDGPWHEDHGLIVFHAADGTLYSVPKDEVDLETSRAMSMPPLVATPPNGRIKLKVSEEEKKLAALGQDIPPPDQLTPQALGAWQKAEIEKWWPIVKAAGIKGE